MTFRQLCALGVLILAPLGARADVPGSPVNRGLSIPITLPKAGKVSLAVYDADGKMVRTLLSGVPRPQGKSTVSWDGLNADGKPVQKGKYTWKLLLNQGMQAEYLLSLGTSVGPDFWPAQHGGPNTVAVLEGGDVLVGGSPEGSPLMVRFGATDSRVKWCAPSWAAPEGTADTAALGDKVYSLQNNGEVRVMDAGTGKLVSSFPLWITTREFDPITPSADPQRKLEVGVGGGSLIRATPSLAAGTTGNLGISLTGSAETRDGTFATLKSGLLPPTIFPRVYNNEWPITPKDDKVSVVFNFKSSDAGAQWGVTKWEALAYAQRLDGFKDTLLATFPGPGTITWVSPDGGKVLARVAVPGVQDAALLDGDRAVAVAGKDLVLVGRDGSVRSVYSGFEAPQRLSVDHGSGRIFVADGGASQQIKSFDSGFHLESNFGRPGGRLEGLYKPEDFLDVADISADGAGGFWICEADSAPRRTAHFDGKGNLLGEWYGGQQFYSFAAADPADPSLVWMDSQWGWVMQCQVDWDKRSYKIRACYRWGGDAPDDLIGKRKMTLAHSVRHFDLDHDGKPETYLVGSLGLQRVDEAAGRLVMVSALGMTGPDRAWSWSRTPVAEQPQAWVQAISMRGDDPAKTFGSYRGFSWADVNGDGKMQADEFRLIKDGGVESKGSFYALASDLAQIRSFNWNVAGKPNWERYPVQGFTPTGAPIWDWSKHEPGFVSPYSSTVALLPDDAGDIYQIAQGGQGDGYTALGTYSMAHGFAWPANQIDSNAVQKWSSNGDVLWRVGQHASHQGIPGELHYPVRFAGLVNGTIGVCDKVVQPVVFWTEDGLYAGSLLDRRAADGQPDRLYRWWHESTDDFNTQTGRALFQYDMVEGGSLFQRPNGDVIYLGAGWNNCPAFRVTGWDQFVRQQGTVQVVGESQPAAGTGSGLHGEYFANSKWEGEPALQKDSDLWFEPARKGHPWPDDAVTKAPFSARWSGLVEPRFSEDYIFSVYGINGAAQLWVDDKLVVTVPQSNRAGRQFSESIPLLAGSRHLIKVEWTGKPEGEIHLNWESASEQIRHIPAASLYPAVTAAVPTK